MHREWRVQDMYRTYQWMKGDLGRESIVLSCSSVLSI